MSRLLMNLILMRHGYPITVIKADETTRNRYLAALSEADAGEPEPFLRFIIENVEASLRLMIRAAKGESIDEPSDLDKKLALLKKQLKTREEYNRSAWHITNQKRFFDETMKFWLQDITNEFERFDDLFLNREIYIDGIDVSRVGFTRPEFTNSDDRNKHTVLEVARKLFNNSDRLLKDIIVYFHWKKLLDFSYPFSVGAHIKTEFSEHNYTAEFAVYERLNDGMGYSPQKLLSSTYDNPLTHSDIHNINHQLANKVYDFIAARLAEAGTSPT